MLTTVPKKKSDFAPGENPESLKNLQPRETLYDEPKKRRMLMATDPGWQGFKDVAKSLGLSASEMAERIGRGTLKISE